MSEQNGFVSWWTDDSTAKPGEGFTIDFILGDANHFKVLVTNLFLNEIMEWE